MKLPWTTEKLAVPPLKSFVCGPSEISKLRPTLRTIDLGQCWQTYGTRAQNFTRKDFFSCRLHCCPNLCYYCKEYVYINTYLTA
jgi:hypothetical protein